MIVYYNDDGRVFSLLYVEFLMMREIDVFASTVERRNDGFLKLLGSEKVLEVFEVK